VWPRQLTIHTGSQTWFPCNRCQGKVTTVPVPRPSDPDRLTWPDLKHVLTRPSCPNSAPTAMRKRLSSEVHFAHRIAQRQPTLRRETKFQFGTGGTYSNRTDRKLHAYNDELHELGSLPNSVKQHINYKEHGITWKLTVTHTVKTFLCEIWGSHGGEYEDVSLLSCTVLSGTSSPTFQRCLPWWWRQ
jgi:hypothetical protein